MKLAQWSLFFIISFLISFILIKTFSQDVFHQSVAAKIIWFSPPAIPIYWYIGGAFASGFCIGLMVIIYNFFRHARKTFAKNKKIKELENEIETYKSKYEQIRSDLEMPHSNELSVQEQES